jgi:uroporphyrin-III C-methyltransferase / precorrin-2 dehydrogenase / sirohydrochlorin ferrochelatase
MPRNAEGATRDAQAAGGAAAVAAIDAGAGARADAAPVASGASTDVRATAQADADLYPVFLRLAGLPVVVVGGGPVAAGKLTGLLEAGARVTVVAPAIAGAIRANAGVALVERGFVASDLDGARWVVAAATPEVNREVAAAAAARGLFVNAVDDVASASAYLGGVVRRGPAVVAISTGGLAPALAGLLREALDAVLPEDLERWIDLAIAVRADWKRTGTPIAERRPLLLRALERIYSASAGRSAGTAGASDRASRAPDRTEHAVAQGGLP